MPFPIALANSPCNAGINFLLSFAGSRCQDIEAVDIVMGNYALWHPFVGAGENFAKLFPGEFMTATDAEGRGAEPVAFIENADTKTQCLVLRNEHLKQVSPNAWF
jgi:hypothetical protein